MPVKGGFELTFVINDAAGCAGPKAVKHKVAVDTVSHAVDTLTVTLRYHSGPCPGVYTPAEYVLSMHGVTPGWHQLRIVTLRDGSQPRLWLSYSFRTP